MPCQSSETMASKTGMVCGGVSVGSEEMVIVLQRHTTCMYMYTTWQATLLKHMDCTFTCEKMHTQVNMQYAYSLLKIHHTHTCTYTLHVHTSTLWPMLEDLLLPTDPEDRSRESFTVSVLMAKKCIYLVAMPTNPLHDYIQLNYKAKLMLCASAGEGN